MADQRLELSKGQVESVQHDHQGNSLGDFGDALAQYKQTGSTSDLDYAIVAGSEALKVMPDEHPKLGVHLKSLFDALTTRYNSTEITDEVSISILAMRRVLELMQGRNGRLLCLSNLSDFLLLRSKRNQSMEDLNEAVAAADEAFLSSDNESSNRSMCLTSLFHALEESFLRTTVMGYLDRAIKIAEMDVKLTSQRSASSRASSLSRLSGALQLRFEQSASLQDLDRAIEVGTQAVEFSPDDNDRAWRLSTLGRALLLRFEQTGLIDDLNRAVVLSNEAVELTPEDANYRSERLNILSHGLQIRFEQIGLQEDLEKAISAARESISCGDKDPSALSQPYLYHTLGKALALRFNWKGSIGDLNDAVDANEEAVKLTPKNHIMRPTFLNNLALILSARYKQFGSLDDLNQAVHVAKQVIDQTIIFHPDRASRLNNLGGFLKEKFERTGSIEDLEAAIVALEEAVDLTPREHANRALCQATLASLLIARYKHIHSTDDLLLAVRVLEEAVALTPKEHLNCATYVNNLALALGLMWSGLGFVEELTRAIQEIDQIMEYIPTSNPMYASLLHVRGSTLLNRSTETGSMEDLTASLADLQKAIDCTFQDNPNLAHYIYCMGIGLQQRFEKTQSSDDLNAAIIALEKSVELTPNDHPSRAAYLKEFGIALELRAKMTLSNDDLTRAVDGYEKAVYEESSPPVTRITAAIKAVEMLGFSDSPRSSGILRIAVQLLPVVNNRALRAYNHSNLSIFAELVSTAAAHLLQSGGCGFEALQLLELGRGVTSGLQLDTRTDCTYLEDEHPQLAKEFKQLQNELNQEDPDVTSIQQSANSQSMRYSAAKRFDSLLENIRRLSGFERFLLGPSEEELMTLAQLGPIVVFNVVTSRSDALLVCKNDIKCLPLPKLHYADIKMHGNLLLDAMDGLKLSNYHRLNKRLQTTLEWLWDVAVESILVALGFTSTPDDDSEWPRVWWVASGWLSLLPLHAAGRYAAKSTENALDRVVSSYTPTLRGLAFARENAEKTKLQVAPECLFVCMPQTPNQVDLPGVVEEVTRIINVLPENMLKHILVTPVTADVEAQLRTCQIVHFACHGKSIPFAPRWSRLLLKDSNSLAVEDIVRLQLEHPQFAYLSACQTAAIRDSQNLDEAIHLAGACQLAGFPHVIATLWQVTDSDSIEVAQDVYSSMTNIHAGAIDVAVASRGLHAAVRRLRDKEVQDGEFLVKLRTKPLLWAPYIHMGT
jgi:tetratricopeptide (TPR) repeat protein